MNGDLSNLRVYRRRNLIARLISVPLLVGREKKKSNCDSRLQLKSQRGASESLLYRNARRLAGWGRCCRWGAAIKAEICDRCCHKQSTGTFHLSMPMCDLPRVHCPGEGLFVALAIRTSHIRQARASKARGKKKTQKTNDVLSASKNPLHNPHLSL